MQQLTHTQKMRVLIVGGLGKGGIGGTGKGGVHTFIKEQYENLSDKYYVEIHNTAPVLGQVVSTFLLSLWQLLRFPIRQPPDIVHINSSAKFDFYRNSLYVLFSSHVWDRPVVVRFGGSGFDEFIQTDSRIKRAYISMVLSSIDRILVLTSLQEVAVTRYVSDQKVTILRQATEIHKFSPEFDHQTPRVLHLTELCERKGTREFIEAVETLLACDGPDCPEFRVDIAGDGEFRTDVEKLAGRDDRVEYHGYVTGKTKYELYNNASIFVLPTYSEGFPSVVIEAMAGGNVIVTTTASGIPEIIGEENGITIEPGDAKQLINTLTTLLSDPARVEEMARRNYAVATESHNWSATVERLEKIYDEALASH